MLLHNVPTDFLNLLFLPLMVMTLIQAWKARKSLWDNELTLRDRFLLQRVVVFLLLPIVVYLHECGHAVATRFFGGTVRTFHYAFFWGYVIPHGNFTNLQVMIIYLAGNVVQAGIGFLCLLLAPLVAAPPVVALLVYLGLWAAAGTLILYALMSFSGLYGDWIAIYSTPLPHLVIAVAIVHIALVAVLLYLIYGMRPKLWFARKTQSGFAPEEAALKSKLQSDPNAASWLALGWCYYRAGLFKPAKQCLAAARSLDAQLPDLSMLQGALAMQAKQYLQAADNFTSAAGNESLSQESQLRSLLALGDCCVEMQKYADAEQVYARALNLDPGCGDTKYLLWILLAKLGRVEEAKSVLLQASSTITYWLDPNLQTRFDAQRTAAQKRTR